MIDQDQIDGPKTPFRVIDEGFAFLIELIIRTSKEGEEDSFYFVPRVVAFESVYQIGPIPTPYPWGWDEIKGPITEITYVSGTAEYYHADPDVVSKAWLQYRQRQRRTLIFGSN